MIVTKYWPASMRQSNALFTPIFCIVYRIEVSLSLSLLMLLLLITRSYPTEKKKKNKNQTVFFIIGHEPKVDYVFAPYQPMRSAVVILSFMATTTTDRLRRAEPSRAHTTPIGQFIKTDNNSFSSWCQVFIHRKRKERKRTLRLLFFFLSA